MSNRIGRVIVDAQLEDDVCEKIASKIQDIEGLDVNPAHDMRLDIMKLTEDEVKGNETSEVEH